MKNCRSPIVLILLILSQIIVAKNIKEKEAKFILNNYFISISEAKKVFPDIPNNLKIPFSKETLEKFSDYWLIPIETTRKYKYFLVKINYDFEASVFEKNSLIDTLNIDEGKRMVYLLNKLRPDFLGRDKLSDEFSIFFRTKTDSNILNGCRQVFSYNKKKFLIADIPDGIEIAILNREYISFFINRNGTEFLGISPLPKEPKVKEKKSITILTLVNVK